MKTILDRYLDRVLVYANQPEPQAEATRQELKDHLLQKVEDLVQKDGLLQEHAMQKAIRDHGTPKVIGYKLRAFFPWIDIRSHGTARGVIAIGPKAVGIVACGGVAVGVFAFGGAAFGLFSVGAVAIGLLFAWAGLGLGGAVVAAVSVGLVAFGGVAIGAVASGGITIGAWVPHIENGDRVLRHYTPENVPVWLTSLEPLLNGTLFLGRHAFTLILPAYLMFVIFYNYLRYREFKRVAGEDGMIDGSNG